MAANRRSVATIDSPEFINITSVNPLISKCEIKVLYVGENRNRSFITKEVATEMAQTLPGCPIVGYYIENKEDFGDHGRQMVIDAEGIKTNTLTVPYGFVAPNSRVWFQKFEDTDEFGNTVVREYLMTEGYLWAGQFEECKRVLENGNPQSMELDEKTLKGYWSTDTNRGIDFFIINDAIFSKLCILGEDVEPCFEGADVTSPKLSATFSKDTKFEQTLFSMIQELKTVLEGGQKMDGMNTAVENTLENSEGMDNTVENTTSEFEKTTEEVTTEGEAAVAAEETPVSTPESEFEKKEDEEDKEKKEDNKDSDDSASSSEENKEDKKDDKKDDEDEDKKKYSLLESELADLKAQFSAMKTEYDELVSFKAGVEDKEKDALISKFSTLSEQDKKDVIDHKAEYSLEEIESKLSILYTRQQMAQAEAVVEEKTETVVEEPAGAVTYNLTNDMATIPDWIKAVREVESTM